MGNTEKTLKNGIQVTKYSQICVFFYGMGSGIEKFGKLGALGAILKWQALNIEHLGIAKLPSGPCVNGLSVHPRS